MKTKLCKDYLIYQTRGGGKATPEVRVPTIIWQHFPENCIKMKELDKIDPSVNVLLSINVKEPISVSLALDRYGLLKEDDFQMPDTSLHGMLVQHFGSSHSASDIKRRSPFREQIMLILSIKVRFYGPNSKRSTFFPFVINR